MTYVNRSSLQQSQQVFLPISKDYTEQQKNLSHVSEGFSTVLG